MNHSPGSILTKADDLNLPHYTDTELESQYDDWIDEVEGDIRIFEMPFQPSRILRELDPIAYRCGFNNWIDCSEIDEVGNRYMLRADIDTCTDDLDRDAEALDEEDTDE